MNNTIDLNYLTRPSGQSPSSGFARSTQTGGGSFGEMAAQLRAEQEGPAVFEDKTEGGFWEQRVERQKEFMELQQKAAARRRMLMKLRMNGGSVSAAELLMGLL